MFGYLRAFGPGSSGNVPPQGGMANIQEGQERRTGRSTTARKSQTVSFFWRQRGTEPADLSPSLKTWRHKFSRNILVSDFSQVVIIIIITHTLSSQRSVDNYIKDSLVTIHPNPGPRDKTKEGKRRRREYRSNKRKEKKNKKQEEKLKQEEEKQKTLKIATWNVQRMSLGTRNKRKAKAVAEFARKEEWDIILLSEVRAESNGTV